MTLITNCTECPLYMRASHASAEVGLPYFGMCRATGRMINAAAAAVLPSDTACPLGGVEPTVEDATTLAADLDAAKLPVPDSFSVLVAPAMATEAVTSTIERPDSCKRCIFFQPKSVGQPGTPAARYDLCQRYGTLIRPGTRAATAATCSGGVKGTPTLATRTLLPIYTAPTGRTVPAPVVGIALDRTTGTPRTFTFEPTITVTPDTTTALPYPYPSTTVPGATMTGISGGTWTTPSGVVITSTPEPVSTVTVRRDTADKLAELSEEALRAALADDAIAAMIPEAIIEIEPPVEVEVADTSGLKTVPKRVNRTGVICSADSYAMPYTLPEGATGVVSVRSTSRGADFIWLPRFSEDSFAESVRSDIPALDEDAYIDHSDLLYKMAVAYVTDSVCALWGDAGTGKTTAIEHIARITRQPFARISIKWATQVDDLIGRWTLRDGSMEWLDGRLTRAWRAGYVVCIDEPNTGKDEVWQALREPFDGGRTLVLDEKDGERIPRHPQTRVFTAMNFGWDARFSGTRPLNDADVDRMQHIVVPYPPREIELQILMAKAPASVTADKEKVEAILNVARDVRAAVNAKTIRISFGARKVLRWADAMQYMTPQVAFDQAVTAWMEPNEARTLTDLCDTYFR